jgi:RNA polymerase sigma-70 factor (ECF subfamily)
MDHDWLAAAFAEHRERLRSVAFRVLGSRAEAEDAVQEAWLRLSRSDPGSIENLAAWLTAVVARVAIDMTRSRSSRREELVGSLGDVDLSAPSDPAVEAETADSVGLALLVVLERLSPSERLAFVLHDMFALPFDEIGPILERSANAGKQLASRARNKVRGVELPSAVDAARHREVVEAFLAASRHGDFEGLVTLLDPDVALEGDAVVVRMGGPHVARGADAVAAVFCSRAQAVQPALVDGHVGFAWIVGERPRVAWNLYFDDDRATIVHIEMHADRARLDRLGVAPLP